MKPQVAVQLTTDATVLEESYQRTPTALGHQLVDPLSDEDMTLMHTTMIGAWNGVENVQQGFPSQQGGPRLIWFESPRWRPKAIQVRVQFGRPGAVRNKTDAQVAYGVGFVRSIYAWKQNFIELPMAPVS
jgi:hypothetical protein